MNSNRNRAIDIDLANGLGLHMILIWGRVAVVQGVPVAYAYNRMLIIICTLILVLYYLFIFFVKYKCIPKVNQGTVLTGVFVLITLIFTIIMWPGNIRYMDPIGNTVFYEICPFIILGMMRNIEHLYYSMVRISKILLLLCVISSIGIVVNGHTTVSTWSTYSMSLSYATLYAVMWLMGDFLNRNRTITLIYFGIGVLILVVFGSRNTLLSIAAYTIVAIMQKKGKNAWLKSLILISVATLFLFWNRILNGINRLARSLGIYSRTINLFISQDYFSDSRTTIHNNIFQLLNEHPFGVGIAGDVAQTQEFAHGLYVSILCTYGYAIGFIVILTIAAILLRAFRKSYGLNRDVLMIYTLIVLPRGFTGGDVWSSDAFWWMLGIAFAIIYMKHNKQILNTELIQSDGRVF